MRDKAARGIVSPGAPQLAGAGAPKEQPSCSQLFLLHSKPPLSHKSPSLSQVSTREGRSHTRSMCRPTFSISQEKGSRLCFREGSSRRPSGEWHQGPGLVLSRALFSFDIPPNRFLWNMGSMNERTRQGFGCPVVLPSTLSSLHTHAKKSTGGKKSLDQRSVRGVLYPRDGNFSGCSLR